MKVLIVTQYFWPENFKINEVAFFLKEEGHNVTVLTGQPNYPDGKFFKGYSFARPKSELFNGILIQRLPTIPRGRRNALKLILNYLFFPIIGRIYWKRLLSKKTFDIIFVCQLSPVFVGLLGLWIKRKLKIPMLMWVLDLWPESIFAASRIKPFLVKMPLEIIINKIYHSCDKILVSSKPFINSILRFGFPAEHIKYLPNWETIVDYELSTTDLKNLPSLPNGFVVLFAGNIGDAQDIETIIKSAEITSNIEDIKWIFIGDGRKRIWLENEIISRKLERQVFCLGRFPNKTMPYFYKNASVLLASLKPNPTFELTVPAKLQSYMANKKPIISMLSGAGNQIVTEANCGLTIESGDYLSLAQTVEKLYRYSPDDLGLLGTNGYSYFLENFEKSKILSNLLLMLNEEISFHVSTSN